MSDDFKRKIIPQGKRLLIQLNSVEEVSKKIKRDDGTETELILPEKHSEESRVGIVIACGEDVDKKFQPGNKILIAYFSGTCLHFPNEGVLDDTIRMIVQSEIMAKVEGNGE